MTRTNHDPLPLLAPDHHQRRNHRVARRSRGTVPLGTLLLRPGTSRHRPRTLGHAGMETDAGRVAGLLAIFGGVAGLVLLVAAGPVVSGIVVFAVAVVALAVAS